MGHDTTPDREDAVAPDAAAITDEAAEAAVGGKSWGFADIMLANQKAMLGDRADMDQLFKDLAPKPPGELARITANVDVACPVQMSGSIGGRFDKP